MLSDPGDAPAAHVQVDPVSGSVAMIEGAFSLDPFDQALIISNFRDTAQIIGEGVDICALRYPRDHLKLGEVRAAVAKCVA